MYGENPNLPNRTDALLKTALALPAASASVDSDALDLGAHNRAFLLPVELVIDLPACTASQLPAAKILQAEVQQAATSDGDFTPLPLGAGIIATGEATNGGAVARRIRFRFPADVNRYVRVRVTAGTGTALSGLSATIRLVF